MQSEMYSILQYRHKFIHCCQWQLNLKLFCDESEVVNWVNKFQRVPSNNYKNICYVPAFSTNLNIVCNAVLFYLIFRSTLSTHTFHIINLKVNITRYKIMILCPFLRLKLVWIYQFFYFIFDLADKDVFCVSYKNIFGEVIHHLGANKLTKIYFNSVY